MDRRSFAALGLAALAAPALAPAPAAATQAMTPPPRLITTPAGLAPWEIHVIPAQFALLWTRGDGRTIWYPVGVARPGLYESGTFYVGAKKEWPSWTPTPGMIEREPELYAKHASGIPGGPDNPLGARALYLFTPSGRDTYLRIHGTSAPSTIGTRVSNGCARLTNAQIADLYERVPMNTRVVLHPDTMV